MPTAGLEPARLSAVILAGGRSVRMGRDKALLLLNGETLLARTTRLAREAGAAPVFISGREGVEGALPDRLPGHGPLEGLATALEAAPPGRVLVLAVDLPALDLPFLRWLLGHAGGVVPQLPGGPEPLAALYPTGAAALAREQLAQGQRSARTFAQAACRAGWCVAVPVPPALAPCLANWNHPGDWRAIDAPKPPPV